MDYFRITYLCIYFLCKHHLGFWVSTISSSRFRVPMLISKASRDEFNSTNNDEAYRPSTN